MTRWLTLCGATGRSPGGRRGDGRRRTRRWPSRSPVIPASWTSSRRCRPASASRSCCSPRHATCSAPCHWRPRATRPLLSRRAPGYMFEEYGDCDSDYVFVNLVAEPCAAPLRYQAVHMLVYRLRERSGVDFTLHMLRHTRATAHDHESVLLGHRAVEDDAV